MGASARLLTAPISLASVIGFLRDLQAARIELLRHQIALIDVQQVTVFR